MDDVKVVVNSDEWYPYYYVNHDEPRNQTFGLDYKGTIPEDKFLWIKEIEKQNKLVHDYIESLIAEKFLEDHR